MDYENFLAFVKSRRSVRKYTTEPITRQQIEKLIEAACWAPSNHNRQGWKFLVFEKVQALRGLAEEARTMVQESLRKGARLAVGQAEELVHFAGAFDQAPVAILALHKKSPAMGRSLLSTATSDLASGEVISTALACQNLLLAAHALGLGACLMTAPLLAGPLWRSRVDLPAGYEPTCLITIGYPAHVPDAPRRKKLEHILEYK
jgi:coenzyme F420-0:L-glutamate ligase / coenzyme F420-1:gamma-L-glutamate ligase